MIIVDILIIIFLLFGFLIGYKSGFMKQVVSTVGFLVVVALAYVTKNFVSTIFYTYLPFFDFGGKVSGVSSINILLYEFLAFIIMFSLFMAIFRIIVKATSLFEKALKATIILGIPSKILGGIFGIIENYVIAFIAIYFLSIPTFGFTFVQESNLGHRMLMGTPILSNICHDTLEAFEKIDDLKDQYEADADKTELDRQILKLLVEKEVINQENVDRLVAQGKIPKKVVE